VKDVRGNTPTVRPTLAVGDLDQADWLLPMPWFAVERFDASYALVG
jgi:hypothetical protein